MIVAIGYSHRLSRERLYIHTAQDTSTTPYSCLLHNTHIHIPSAYVYPIMLLEKRDTTQAQELAGSLTSNHGGG